MFRFFFITVVLTSFQLSSADEPDSKSVKAKPPVFASLKTASAQVTAVYGEAIQQAKNNDQKRTLARKMIDDGLKTKDDLAIRHELFRMARDIAIGIGDAKLAIQSVTSTAASFDVDGLRMKASTLHKLSQRNRLKAVHQELAKHFDAVIADAVAQDRFDIATSLAAIALASAKKSGMRNIVRPAAKRPKEIKELAESYEKVKTALATLRTNLSDAKANGVVGKYYCFVKGDWKEGLPFLASGDDPQIKALAEKEGEKSSEPLALGDGWWKVAEGLDGRGKLNVQQRSAENYRRALPKLEGFAKTRVEKRLAGLADSQSERRPTIDLLKLINVKRDGVGRLPWRVRNRSLISPAIPPKFPDHEQALLQVPYAPPPEYKVIVVFTPRGRTTRLSLGLPASENRCTAIVNGANGACGLAQIDTKHYHVNESTYKGPSVVIGKRNTVECTVLKNKITVTCNGRQLIKYEGRHDRLAVPKKHRPPVASAISIGASGGLEIHSIELQAISGTGKHLK